MIKMTNLELLKLNIMNATVEEVAKNNICNFCPLRMNCTANLIQCETLLGDPATIPDKSMVIVRTKNSGELNDIWIKIDNRYYTLATEAEGDDTIFTTNILEDTYDIVQVIPLERLKDNSNWTPKDGKSNLKSDLEII